MSRVIVNAFFDTAMIRVAQRFGQHRFLSMATREQGEGPVQLSIRQKVQQLFV